jgi:hexaprenyl-diphosphate synthase
MFTSTSTRPCLFLSSLPRRGRRALQGLAAQPVPKYNPGPLTPADLRPPKRVDPFDLVTPELSHLRTSLLTLLGSAHPGLTSIAEYYFLQPSKQLRPLLVLLFAHATNGLGAGWGRKHWAAHCQGARGMAAELDAPLTRADVLNDWNPNIPEHTASFQTTFNLVSVPAPSSPLPPPPATSAALEPCVVGQILPTQVRLAQIAEMIHVASLLHDDVIDDSPLRRGVPSSPEHFGNKLTILGGDFLLGRASAALSRLGEPEVVELVASVIANLVEGEVMQAREVYSPETLPDLNMNMTMRNGDGWRVSQHRWNTYLKKTYLKTASLIAKTVRSSVILGGCRDGEIWKEVAYAYGRNIGIAFQVGVACPLITWLHNSACQRTATGANVPDRAQRLTF